MKLGPLSHARVVLGRPLARAVFRSRVARYLLLRERTADLARGLDEDIAFMLALDARSHDSHIWNRSADGARAKMAEGIAIVAGPPPEGVTTRRLRVRGAAGDLDARLYVPAASADAIAARAAVAGAVRGAREGRGAPGVVFVHGGGWVTGDLDTHDVLCREIAARGNLRVVAVDYRRAPEHPFPAAADDAIAAFRSIVARAGELGLDPTRLAIAGDSAGGNLSAVVGLATREDAVRPALTVLLYPALDATRAEASHRTLADGYYLTSRAIDWYYAHYMGSTDPHDPRLSPIFEADLRGASPALVVIASFDPLRDEAERYAARLEEAGVEVVRQVHPSLIHGFALMTGICRAARRATDEMIDAIATRLRAG